MLTRRLARMVQMLRQFLTSIVSNSTIVLPRHLARSLRATLAA